MAKAQTTRKMAKPAPAPDENAPANAATAAESNADDDDDDDSTVVVDDFNNTVDDLLKTVDLRPATLAADLRDVTIEIIRNRPAWADLLEKEQRDLGRSIQTACEGIVRKVVRALAMEERPAIEAQLKKFGMGSEKFTVALEAEGDEMQAFNLAKLVGHEVLVISADAQSYLKDRPLKVVRDQAPLEFDEAPLNDGASVDLYRRVRTLVVQSRSTKPDWISTECGCSVEAAESILAQLETANIVSEKNGDGFRIVTVDSDAVFPDDEPANPFDENDDDLTGLSDDELDPPVTPESITTDDD